MGRVPKAAQPADAARMIAEHENRLRQAEARLADGGGGGQVFSEVFYYDSNDVVKNPAVSVFDPTIMRTFTPATRGTMGAVWAGDATMTGVASVPEAAWIGGKVLLGRLKNSRIEGPSTAAAGQRLVRPALGYFERAIVQNLGFLVGSLFVRDAFNSDTSIPAGWTEAAENGDIDFYLSLTTSPEGYGQTVWNLPFMWPCDTIARTS